MVVPHSEQVGRPASDLGVFVLISASSRGTFPKTRSLFCKRSLPFWPISLLCCNLAVGQPFRGDHGNDHIAVSTVGILTDPYLFPTLGLPHGWRPSPSVGVHELRDDPAANSTRFAGGAEALERGLAYSEGQGLREVPALPTYDTGTADVPRQPTPTGMIRASKVKRESRLRHTAAPVSSSNERKRQYPL